MSPNYARLARETPATALSLILSQLRGLAVELPQLPELQPAAALVTRLAASVGSRVPAGETADELCYALRKVAQALVELRPLPARQGPAHALLLSIVAGQRRERLVADLDAALELTRVWERDEL